MRLQGKTVGYFLAQEVEDLEFWVPLMRLREEGARTIVIGLSNEKVRGHHGLEMTPDVSIEEAPKASAFDGLVIPGGFAPDRLRRNQGVLQLVREVYAQGKIVASICHGGWVPISAGIIRGHKATGTSAIKDDITNAGGIWVDESAFRDGNIVWGRVVEDIPNFCRELVAALEEWTYQRFFGISINDHQPWNALRLIETGVVDTVEVIYNIFDQSPEDELFPACRQHNIGVIVRAPLDESGLTGRITPESTFDENDFRSRYFRDDRKQEVYTRVQSIAADLGISLDALPEIALRYILSNPVVSTVIPGMRSARNVERNIALSDGYTLSPEQLQKLKKYRWVRDFYKKV